MTGFLTGKPTSGIRTAYITVSGLGSKTEYNNRKIKSVSLLGSDEIVSWTQNSSELSIGKPSAVPSPEAIVNKVTLR